jgi:FtsH-binding integral membrane protein
MGVVILKYIFHLCLLGALLLSLYIFIDITVLKNKTYINIFSTWQFPMLLALYMDVIYKS